MLLLLLFHSPLRRDAANHSPYAGRRWLRRISGSTVGRASRSSAERASDSGSAGIPRLLEVPWSPWWADSICTATQR